MRPIVASRRASARSAAAAASAIPNGKNAASEWKYEPRVECSVQSSDCARKTSTSSDDHARTEAPCGDGRERPKQHEEREQRRDRVRHDRAALRGEDIGERAKELRGGGWRDPEELLVVGEQHRPREQIGRADTEIAREPQSPDREREPAAGETGTARRRAEGEREERQTKERSLRASEIKESHEEAGCRAAADRATRCTTEREEEERADQRRRCERVGGHPARCEDAAESDERRGPEGIARRYSERARRGVRGGRKECGDGDHRGLRRAELAEDTAEECDAAGLQRRREGHPEL